MPATANPRLGGRTNQPYILAQSAVPVILAPNATWNNTTGSFTLGTPLPTTYSGGAWIRFAGVGVNTSTGGPAASGLYWCVMSTTQNGQAFALSADPSQQFIPYVPGSNGAQLATTAGTHVQTTAADITLANITVPGGAMGLSGALRITSEFLYPSNANNKSSRLLVGGSALFNYTRTTVVRDSPTTLLRNRGALNVQGFTDNSATSSTYTNLERAINTSVDQPMAFVAQLAVATDYVVWTGAIIEVLPS